MRLLLPGFVSMCACWMAPANAMSGAMALELAQPGYDARESVQGFVLNHERGRLDAVALSVEVAGGSGAWTLRGSSARGTVHYGGLSQLGVPLSTTTRLQVDAAELGWSPPWSMRIAEFELQPRLGVSSRHIDRAVQASAQSTRLTEKLDASQVHVAMVARRPLGMGWRLHVEAELARPFRQRLHVDTFGFYDDFTMRPHARNAVRFAAGVEWEHGAHWGLALQVEQLQLKFGTDGPRDVSRDGAVVGSANYPGSVQHLAGAQLRIRYRF
jgi:hypothetical protein